LPPSFSAQAFIYHSKNEFFIHFMERVKYEWEHFEV